MNSYIQFTKDISYKRERKLMKDPYTEKTVKCLEVLNDMLLNIPQVKSLFDETDVAANFFDNIVTFKEMGLVDEEAFYIRKLKSRMIGVPSRIVYIVNKAISVYGKENPNYTLSSVYKYLLKYDDYLFENEGKQYTLLDIIYYLFYDNFDLLTARRLKAGNEIYVDSVNKVAIIPNDILSIIDVKTVDYDPKLGLTAICDEQITPLRIMCGRIGATTDDFDLRKAI